MRPSPVWEDKDAALYSINYQNNRLLNMDIEETEGLNDPEMLIA